MAHSVMVKEDYWQLATFPLFNALVPASPAPSTGAGRLASTSHPMAQQVRLRKKGQKKKKRKHSYDVMDAIREVCSLVMML